MSRGHVSGNLQAGVQPLQAFPSGQSLTGYAEHVYQEPEGQPPVETNSIRYWRDWAGLRNGQTELRLNNQRAPRVHGLGWGLDPDAGVWRPLRVDATGALVVAGGGPTPEPGPPTQQLGAWWRADDAGTVDGANVTSWTDRSGYLQTLGPVAGVNAPTWQASVPSLGNRPAVQFAANSGLRLALPPGFVAGKHAVTVYVVLQIDTFTPAALPFYYGPLVSAVFGDNLGFILVNGPDRFGTSIRGGSALANADTAARIVSARAPNNTQWGNSFLTFDGAAPAGLSYANPTVVLDVPSPVGSVSVGGLDGLWDFRGRIAEVLYYHKNQDGTERANTLLYLSQRYGIPLV